MDFSQTIVAISTAPGAAAIALIRLSGQEAIKILQSIFRSSENNLTKVEFQSHQAKHGFIFDKNKQEIVDEVMVTVFLQPHSYTGEDVVEISCHGNPVLTRRILALCLGEGARLAEAGEFTRRAFISGKMDLTQAEAVLDLIQSKTEKSSQVALSVLKGDLGKQIQLVREDLKKLLTSIVASLDFPDEVDLLDEKEIDETINRNLIRLQELYSTASSGKFLREGLKLAIVGRPNAGKSSLLNALLKVERAIVTDIPGTTRDSLEEQLDIKGIPVTLVDTAGIRDTTDQIEKLGIERTKHVLSDSQLVLLVADITRGWHKDEDEIIAAMKNKPWILLWNKNDLLKDNALFKDNDLPKDNNLPNNNDLFKDIISQGNAKGALTSLSISAKTGNGIDDLAKYIEQWALADSKIQDKGASLNTRQASLCAKAITALQLVKKTLLNKMPHDCLSTDLKSSLDYLSEIDGISVSQEVINSVFASFCIGK